ncbi:MAG: hypothetical protein QF715_10270 [Pseudomonadales bacterium]|nr:hypothetical protein [Pseudomonadales bacterium]|tara:strand:- start:3855 stop:5186 length:1332 start_codon:yes stop_codon:yes gene_type:complete
MRPTIIFLITFMLQITHAENKVEVEGVREIAGQLTLLSDQMGVKQSRQREEISLQSKLGNFEKVHEIAKQLKATTKYQAPSIQTQNYNLIAALSGWLADYQDGRLEDLENSQYEKYVDDALAICQLKTDCFDVLRARSAIYFGADKLAQARRIMRAVIEEQTGNTTPDTLDDIELLSKMGLVEGKLQMAHFAIDRLVRVGQSVESSDPLLAIDAYQRWLEYLNSSIRAGYYYRGRILPGKILERYKLLAAGQFEDSDQRLSALVRYIEVAHNFGISTGKIRAVQETFIELLETSPPANTELVRYLLFISDMFIQIKDHERAQVLYEKVYKLLKDEGHDLQIKLLFEEPKLLSPRGLFRPMPLDRKPAADGPGVELFADYTYSVSKNGRAKNVRIANANVPIVSQRLFKYLLREAIFRPRLMGGELVQTDDLAIRAGFFHGRGS